MLLWAAVALTVRYRSAEEFVTDYVDNLSRGGLFLAGTCELDMLHELDVELVVEGATHQLRARPVYLNPAGDRPGVGMEITYKPAGFAAAMRDHLLRLGKRREVAVMIGDVPNGDRFAAAGFKLIPLEPPETLIEALSHALVPVIALVVRQHERDAYAAIAKSGGKLIAVYGVSGATDADDVIHKIDRLL